MTVDTDLVTVAIVMRVEITKGARMGATMGASMRPVLYLLVKAVIEVVIDTRMEKNPTLVGRVVMGIIADPDASILPADLPDDRIQVFTRLYALTLYLSTHTIASVYSVNVWHPDYPIHVISYLLMYRMTVDVNTGTVRRCHFGATAGPLNSSHAEIQERV